MTPTASSAAGSPASRHLKRTSEGLRSAYGKEAALSTIGRPRWRPPVGDSPRRPKLTPAVRAQDTQKTYAVYKTTLWYSNTGGPDSTAPPWDLRRRSGQDVHELTDAARVKHVGVDIAVDMPKAAEALEACKRGR